MPARTLEIGWYGYDFDAKTERAKWELFLATNRGAVLQRATWSTSDWIAVLIEVRQQTVWSFPGGLPKPAPRGFKTTLRDLTNEPDPSPGFVVMVEELTGSSYKVFQKTGKVVTEVAGEVKAAAQSTQTLLYVGAGVFVLWMLMGGRDGA